MLPGEQDWRSIPQSREMQQEANGEMGASPPSKTPEKFRTHTSLWAGQKGGAQNKGIHSNSDY